MDIYTAAQKQWAAARLGIPRSEILELDFDLENGAHEGCETCGWGADDPTFQVIVRMADGSNSKIIKDDVSTVIREMVECVEDVL